MVLRALKYGYGPFEGPHEGHPRPHAYSCATVDFDVTRPTRFEDNRKGTLALLELADRYAVPLTWAVCGKAAEDDSRSYSAILNSSTRHEVGVHTFSHIDATSCTAEDFRADIERCIGALGRSQPRTFVFPWNREAHFDVLRDLGFRNFRGKARAIGLPMVREGLIDVRPVYYVDQKSEGAESLMTSYINLCVKRSAVFHLWTHPWSLVIGGSTAPMMATLERVFAHMAALRDERSLATLTVDGVGASTMTDVAQPETASGPSPSERARVPN